ncbi:MAG: FAD-dependent oxidoreductase [Candidatus Omnitrophica bacterium]|nr:FAD-dependent oxidoreductase [Candidatus Omnitrophota bacterium]
MRKIVIIGASVAGHNLAVNLRNLGNDSSITLITEEASVLYDKNKLIDFVSGAAKENDLFLTSADIYQNSNINFVSGKKVNLVNADRKQVYFKEKGSVEYDYLVIASGRRIVLPEISGAKKDGVFALNTLGDYRKFLTSIIRETVCVVGSDDRALNLAKAINAKFKVEVKLFSQRLFDQSLLVEGIEVINLSIKEIIGEGCVQAVKLSDGSAIGVCAVLFLESLKSNIEFMKNTALEISADKIIVGDNLNTNIENIFSCGSVCARKDNLEIIKSTDEVISESLYLSDVLIKQVKGEICQTC